MSEKLFEIAFSGKIVDGADLDSVKQKIATLFKADEARLNQLFSGRRVVVKRQADEITAIKFRGAFQKAGAICELVELSGAATTRQAPATPAAATDSRTAPVASSTGSAYVSKYAESDQVPQALLTEPLGIKGEDIQDLGADVAPVGSPMQHQIKDVPEPVIDTSGLDVAPVGSDLTTKKGDRPPPLPDTSGLSMAD
jgi:ketosteroid isomerase-like protein